MRTRSDDDSGCSVGYREYTHSGRDSVVLAIENADSFW